MQLVPFGYCQSCGVKMKIVAPETTPAAIAKTRICTNPICLKHDTYRTYEIHEARYQRLLAVEGGPVVAPHSYERALTPVEAPKDAAEVARLAMMKELMETTYTFGPRPIDVVEPAEAEAALARDVAQNRAFYALKKRFDNGELDVDEFDRLKRELDEG